MLVIRSKVMLAMVMLSGLTAALGFGCADVDPRYGPPQATKGREVDFGLDAGGPAPVVEAGPSTKSAKDIFADLFTALDVTVTGCLPCHGAAQQPVFLLADAEATRAKFKTLGYDKLATSRVYLKVQHAGPPMNAAEKGLMQQWSAAEAAGRGTTPVDAGGD